jgi:6-phosphofructokinase 1
MVAMSYGNLAISLLLNGDTGHMVSLQSGVYTAVPMDMISKSVKRVDVDELYDVEQYRPKVSHQMGKPMFLY